MIIKHVTNSVQSLIKLKYLHVSLCTLVLEKYFAISQWYTVCPITIFLHPLDPFPKMEKGTLQVMFPLLS